MEARHLEEQPGALTDANAELVLKLRRELAAKRVKIKRMGGRSALFLQQHLHSEAKNLKDKTELKAELSRLSAKHSEEVSRRFLAQRTLAVMKDRMAELKKRYVKETKELKSALAYGRGYEGEWKNGVPHGTGTITYENGNVYDGEWENGKLHGTGTFTWAAGDVYEGPWVNGKRHGTGTYTWACGDAYEGGFENGQRHGRGTTTYANGDTAEGEFVEGRRTNVTIEGTCTNAKSSMAREVNSPEHESDESIKIGAAPDNDHACALEEPGATLAHKSQRDLAAEREKLEATVTELKAKHSEELSRRQLAQKTIAVMKEKLEARVKETKELERDFAAERRMEKARSASALEELKRKHLIDLMESEIKLLEEARARAKEADEINEKSEAALAKRLDKLEVTIEENRKRNESKHFEIIAKGKATDARIEEVREGILKELLELRTANKIYESKLAEKGADLTSIRREIRAAQEQQSRTEGAPCGAGVASGLQTLQEGRAEKKAASKPKSKSCIAMTEKENRENAASDAYDKMIVNDLRKELRKRNLSVEGRKAELQARLRQNDAERASTLIDLCSP